MRLLQERLAVKGRLTFAEYMGLALYSSHGGYYAAAGSEPARDYHSSPETHPLFGALIALQLEQMWHVLGTPRRFTILEAGAGGGSLCRDIMSFAVALEPSFWGALDYVIVEPQRAALGQQSALLGKLPSRVRWIAGSALALPARDLVGCILSNELLDAFPVHRVVRQGRGLLEAYVVANDGQLGEVLDEPETPELSDYFDWLGLAPAEGCLFEVNLQAPRFIREAARALSRGFVLTVDYGEPAEVLFGPHRPAGTLRCFSRHRVSGDPYDDPGKQDITAHVDFSALVLAGREAGLRFTGLTLQREFLLNLGYGAFLDRLERSSLPEGVRFANKFAMQDLIARGGLGAYRVLIQHIGVEDPDLDAFNVCNDRKRRLGAGDSLLPLPLR